MSVKHIMTYWRRGWSAVLVLLICKVGFMLVGFAVGKWVPDTGYWQLLVYVALLIIVAPVLAWAAVQFVFPGAHPLPALRTAPVATFSDEASAHIALSLLHQGGVRAIVTSGAVGLQAGLPLPAGGVQVVVSTRDWAQASELLRSARESRGRR
jgi:hypothetical protein